jgi:NAD(P)-dependent dehydrogenase (short-subunit alcohol dehydrogenase family)
MTTVLVVGSNRGIGLELCRQLTKRGDEVIGTCRETSPGLEELDIEVIEGVDITSDAAVNDLAQTLSGRELDWLVVVAGVLDTVGLHDLDLDIVERLFRVNSVGPLRVVAALRGHMKSPSKVGLLTSRMGSIEDNTSGGSYAYRMSKAALNAAGKSLAVDLEGDGIAVRLLHPGWVRTDMTNHNGLIDPPEAVEGLIARMDELTLKTTGEFWHQKGEKLPW